MCYTPKCNTFIKIHLAYRKLQTCLQKNKKKEEETISPARTYTHIYTKECLYYRFVAIEVYVSYTLQLKNAKKKNMRRRAHAPAKQLKLVHRQVSYVCIYVFVVMQTIFFIFYATPEKKTYRT